MAVFDAQWVGYWWPELLIWFATLGLVIALPIILWRQWRQRRISQRRIRRGVTVYLDDNFVRGLRDAEDEEIEELDTHTRESDGGLAVKLLHVGKKASVTREIRRKFRKTSEPSALIGGMLEVLDRADEIVRVDLIRLEVTASPALAASLDIDHDNLPEEVRLLGAGGFVLLRGRFRVINDADGVVTLAAAYGEPAELTTRPQVIVNCIEKHILNATTGTILGTCFGWVEDWGPHAIQLTFHPIALFR